MQKDASFLLDAYLHLGVPTVAVPLGLAAGLGTHLLLAPTMLGRIQVRTLLDWEVRRSTCLIYVEVEVEVWRPSNTAPLRSRPVCSPLCVLVSCGCGKQTPWPRVVVPVLGGIMGLSAFYFYRARQEHSVRHTALCYDV